MTLHDVRFPNETDEYRAARDELLRAEMALRDQIEAVAALRRELPLGGLVENYTFISPNGPVQLADLFGDHDTLILYGFMFGAGAQAPCPMCSAFMDSVSGQLEHIHQRAAFAVVARNDIEPLAKLFSSRGWQDVPFVSAAGNTFPTDYHTEMPNGAQVPMCHVFTRRDGELRHFWTSELFFTPSDFHPRHIDMLWPLWHFFDITPEGRGEFMPRLEY